MINIKRIHKNVHCEFYLCKMNDRRALGKCQNNVRVRVSGPRCQNVSANQVTDTTRWSRVTKPKITWLHASRWYEWSEFRPFNSRVWENIWIWTSYRQNLIFNNANRVKSTQKVQWNQPKQVCLYKSITKWARKLWRNIKLINNWAFEKEDRLNI